MSGGAEETPDSELVEGAEGLLRDRQRGASEIEATLVELLADHLAEEGAPRPAELADITRLVLDLHGEMANLVNLVDGLWRVVEEAEGDAAVASEADAFSEAAVAALAAELADRRVALEADRGAALADSLARLLAELGDRDVILTLSRSGSLLAALPHLPRLARVFVGEGRPLREGVTAARELAKGDLAVTVATDAVLASLPLTGPELPGALRFDPQRAAVVVGADALGPSGVTNKSGTLALAVCARRAHVPVVAVADESKLWPAALAEPAMPLGDPVELGAPASVEPLGRSFERVPWELVEAVVLPSGVLRPEAVRSRCRERPVSRFVAAALA